ncbi:MAG: hypothetical protein WC250_01605 [Candidatus Paceibacterota bacterium]|jgi:hypothetical protein
MPTAELDISKETLHREAVELGLPITKTLNWSHICARRGLVNRARELGHPDPTHLETEDIARLGNHITRLAGQYGHPNPENASLAQVRPLLPESALAEISPEKLKSLCAKKAVA